VDVTSGSPQRISFNLDLLKLSYLRLHTVQLRRSFICRVANVETKVSSQVDRKGDVQKQMSHHAAAPNVTTNASDLLDEVCGTKSEIPAGEATMAVKDADVPTSVAAVTRSIVFVASEV
jgi:hypothetical protein